MSNVCCRCLLHHRIVALLLHTCIKRCEFPIKWHVCFCQKWQYIFSFGWITLLTGRVHLCLFSHFLYWILLYQEFFIRLQIHWDLQKCKSLDYTEQNKKCVTLLCCHSRRQIWHTGTAMVSNEIPGTTRRKCTEAMNQRQNYETLFCTAGYSLAVWWSSTFPRLPSNQTIIPR